MVSDSIRVVYVWGGIFWSFGLIIVCNLFGEKKMRKWLQCLSVGLLVLLALGFVGCSGGKFMELSEKDEVIIYRCVYRGGDPGTSFLADKIELKDRMLIMSGEIILTDNSNVHNRGVANVVGDKLQIEIPKDAPYEIYIYHKNGEEKYYYLK